MKLYEIFKKIALEHDSLISERNAERAAEKESARLMVIEEGVSEVVAPIRRRNRERLEEEKKKRKALREERARTTKEEKKNTTKDGRNKENGNLNKKY